MSYREQNHIYTMKRRRDYLNQKLSDGTWKGNPQYAVAEHDALDWAVGILDMLLNGTSEQVRELTTHDGTR